MEASDRQREVSDRDQWARFRFSVIGPLLAAPPVGGELQQALQELAAGEYQHPLSKRPITLGVSTIERWYYRARLERDPVAALRNQVRSDAGGHPSVSAGAARGAPPAAPGPPRLELPVASRQPEGAGPAAAGVGAGAVVRGGAAVDEDARVVPSQAHSGTAHRRRPQSRLALGATRGAQLRSRVRRRLVPCPTFIMRRGRC